MDTRRNLRRRILIKGRRELLHSRLFWGLSAANVAVVIVVALLSRHNETPQTGPVRIAPVAFADLPDWQASDSRSALEAFRRSCATILTNIPQRPFGGISYAGATADWLGPCKAVPEGATPAAARAYFETWFTPSEVTAGSPAFFTGYYEPELAGRVTRDARYRVPVYGRPSDLVSVDLGLFRHMAAGTHIYGRISGSALVPYTSRAEIDAQGLPQAPVLLYTDDPVGAFFAAIQGSGRVRFPDGSVERLLFAATNGRPYTSVGRVLIARGALDRKTVSLQTIRAWLKAHPAEARQVMEEDESFVFFAVAPLGDPRLGGPGTEGVPLTPEGSLAVDPRIHAMGVPVYVATRIPTPGGRASVFDRLLVAQDTGGAIRGPVRGDIFFGTGSRAETIAGHMKSEGRFFVLLPKAVAAKLAPYRDFPDEVQ